MRRNVHEIDALHIPQKSSLARLECILEFVVYTVNNILARLEISLNLLVTQETEEHLCSTNEEIDPVSL
jgi:hypothetical protein